MKKIVFSLLSAVGCLLLAVSIWASFGEFGDGTSKSDTVYMQFCTWDSSGHGADADSVCWLRFIHGSLVDSVSSTDATYKTRTGMYVLPKRAFDGTNYGQYTVYFWFNYTDKDKRVYQSNSYMVRDGDIENQPQNVEELLDSLKNQDDWVSGFDPSSDSVTIDKSNAWGLGVTVTDDSITIDISNAWNLVADRPAIGDTIQRNASTFDHTSDEVKIVSTDTIAWVTNEVNVVSSDTIAQIANEVSDDMVKISGSQESADSLEDVLTGTARTLSVHYDSTDFDGTFWHNIAVRSDSGASASVDTFQIKTMNENNQWGASFVWNYSVRTLTSGEGSGVNSVVVRCKSLSDSSSIAFAQIQILDSTESSTSGLLTSDSQGRGFFALDNGIYCVRQYKPGWQFTVPETLKVDGDEDTTYYAEMFDPGSPPQASLCRVYGWIYDINDQPVVGTKIEASIKTIPLRYQNVVISPYYKSTLTDDDGFWYLDLYPNSVLSPSDNKYIFHIFSPSGTILRLETEVPDQTSWELQW